jgi:Holliday junction resolvasome RuvABC endonuclease subunit
MRKQVSQPLLFAEHTEVVSPFAPVKRDTSERGLLSLDIATKTGFCTRTASGVWSLAPKKDESKGMRLVRFKGKLTEICKAEGIRMIVFETPAINGKFPNFVGMEMVGVLKLFCTENNIDHTGYPPTVIQKFATGKGKGNKPLMIKTC